MSLKKTLNQVLRAWEKNSNQIRGRPETKRDSLFKDQPPDLKFFNQQMGWRIAEPKQPLGHRWLAIP